MFIVRRRRLSNASSRVCHSGVNGSTSACGGVNVTCEGGPRSAHRRSTTRGTLGRDAPAAAWGASAQSGSGFGAQPASSMPESAIIVTRTCRYRKLVLALCCTRLPDFAREHRQPASILPRVCLLSRTARGATRPQEAKAVPAASPVPRPAGLLEGDRRVACCK